MRGISYIGNPDGLGAGNVEWKTDTSAPANYVPCKGQGLIARNCPALVASGYMKPGAFQFLLRATSADNYSSTTFTKPDPAIAIGQGYAVISTSASGATQLNIVGYNEGFGGCFLNGGYASLGVNPAASTVTGVSFANDLLFVGTSAGLSVYSASASGWFLSRVDRTFAETRDDYTSINFQKVVYGNGVYVGASPAIYSATGPTFNTADWTSHTITGSSGTFVDIQWDGLQFILLYTASIHTSPDAQTWTKVTPTGLTAFGNFTSLASDGLTGYLLACNASGAEKLAKSTNLTSWTQITIPASLVAVSGLKATPTGAGAVLSTTSTTSSAGSKAVLTADLGTTTTSMFDNTMVLSGHYNAGVQDVVSDNGIVLMLSGKNSNTQTYFTWFGMSTQAPRLRPMNIGGTLYYPYLKVT